MATTQTTVDLNFGYADSTTRKLSIGNYDSDSAAVGAVKGKIMNFNSTGINNVKNLYLSDGGAQCTGITSAAITTITDRPINLND